MVPQIDGPRSPRPRIRRFPHVYQLDEMDCGAACLAMICRHFGRAVRISHIRARVTRDRRNEPRGITGGASELGLAARSMRASKSRLDELPLPAIIHWEGNHWVVALPRRRKHVRVADPATGLGSSRAKSSSRAWSGYAALFDYTERLARRAGGADEPLLAQAVLPPASRL